MRSTRWALCWWTVAAVPSSKQLALKPDVGVITISEPTITLDPQPSARPLDAGRPVAVVAELIGSVCTPDGADKIPPKLAELDLVPDRLYEKDPVCNLTSAGPRFCKHKMRAFCNKAVLTSLEDSLCKSHSDMSIMFDQFSLEPTMLGKWLNSSHLCVACV